MKLKYYLRGLAVGILITTMILAVANLNNRPLTDAQIRERALALGMVDEGSARLTSGIPKENVKDSLKENKEPAETQPPNPSGEPAGQDGAQDKTTQDKTVIDDPDAPVVSAAPQSLEGSVTAETAKPPAENEAAETAEPSAENVAAETPQPAEDTNEAPAETEETASAEPVTIKVSYGASSYSVSLDLAAAGLVDNALAYDDYLCRNGYARKIRTGTYEIKPGTDKEEIAKILTGG